MLSGFSFSEPTCIHFPLDFNGTYTIECPNEEVILGGNTTKIGITDITS